MPQRLYKLADVALGIKVNGCHDCLHGLDNHFRRRRYPLLAWIHADTHSKTDLLSAFQQSGGQPLKLFVD